MSRNDAALIRDMVSAIEKALEFTDGVDLEMFELDDLRQFAVVRALEILGEASKLISSETKLLAPEIPWRDIARTRDKMIHHYF